MEESHSIPQMMRIGKDKMIYFLIYDLKANSVFLFDKLEQLHYI